MKNYWNSNDFDQNSIQNVIIFFSKTSFHRYTPLLFGMSLMSVAAWSLLNWLHSNGLQTALVFFEFFKNYKVPYFAYIFAKVSKDHFPTVSSLTHAAIFASTLFSFVFLDFFTHRIATETIFYVIFATQIIAVFVALCLPSVYRIQPSTTLCNHSVWIFEQLKCAYTNGRIIIWSLWFICGTAIINEFTNVLLKKLSNILSNREDLDAVSWNYYLEERRNEWFRLW